MEGCIMDIYYKIEKKEVVKVIKDYFDAVVKCEKMVLKLKDDLGANAVYAREGNIFGFVFNNEVPDGWKKPGKLDRTLPKKSNKKVWDKLNSLPKYPDCLEINKLLNFPGSTVYRMYLITRFQFGINYKNNVAYFTFPSEKFKNWQKPNYAIEINGTEYKELCAEGK